MLTTVTIPDIGEFDEVDVIEVLVEPGQSVAADESLITLESDKASMDVPAPVAGRVKSVGVKVGDKVSEGDVIVEIESDDEADDGGAAGDEAAEAALSTGDAVEAGEDERAAHGDQTTEDEPGGSDSAARPARGAAASPAEAAAAPRRPIPKGNHETQLLVLGSGPGGYSAAFRAADLGLEVTLVERYPVLGGVCLNVGCIPSKALLHVAEVMTAAAELDDKGVSFGEPEVDPAGLVAWKQSVVDRLVKGLSGMAEKRGVEVVQGEGTLVGPHELQVRGKDGERTISFAAAVLAAGSRNVVLPNLPDDPRLLDSTSALQLEEIPQRLLVVGGGIIGLEMATVYDALGAKVSVVELLDRLMTGCDADLVKPLERRIRRRYENIWVSTKVTAIEATDAGLEVSFEGPKAPDKDTFDRVLIAVGRRPNSDRLGLEAAGIETDEHGFVRVDEYQRTNLEHVFAIGDLTGNPMLAHKASHEGKVAAEVAAGEPSAFDARVIPSVAYTDPEVAWVGLGEEEAAERGIEVETGTFPWLASGRSLALGRTEGVTKLVFDPETHRLLGAGIVGPRAGDLIAEAALAIEMGADARDLSLTIHAHPTLSETLMFAAEAFEGTITDLYLPKRQGKQ